MLKYNDIDKANFFIEDFRKTRDLHRRLTTAPGALSISGTYLKSCMPDDFAASASAVVRELLRIRLEAIADNLAGLGVSIWDEVPAAEVEDLAEVAEWLTPYIEARGKAEAAAAAKAEAEASIIATAEIEVQP